LGIGPLALCICGLGERLGHRLDFAVGFAMHCLNAKMINDFALTRRDFGALCVTAVVFSEWLGLGKSVLFPTPQVLGVFSLESF
jgi:hypothetical protein